MIVVKLIAIIIIGYLLGSIPWGFLIGRWLARVDVRDYGSGKIGTTNVLRTVGKKAAFLVMALDVFKGALAAVIGGLLFGPNHIVIGNVALGMLTAQVLAALAAMAGHNWPIFLKFKGGRGVATFFGGLIALCPGAALFGGEIGILGAGITKFASLGSLAGVVGAYAILVPLTILNGFPIEYIIYVLIGGVAIILTHRDNIFRIYKGIERRLGEKAEKVDPPS
jgi:glycerol-3-phosphate acyltransferase PlsY